MSLVWKTLNVLVFFPKRICVFVLCAAQTSALFIMNSIFFLLPATETLRNLKNILCCVLSCECVVVCVSVPICLKGKKWTVLTFFSGGAEIHYSLFPRKVSSSIWFSFAVLLICVQKHFGGIWNLRYSRCGWHFTDLPLTLRSSVFLTGEVNVFPCVCVQ